MVSVGIWDTESILAGSRGESQLWTQSAPSSLSEVKDDSKLRSHQTKESIDKMIIGINSLSELFPQKGEAYEKTAFASRFSALDKFVVSLSGLDGQCSAARSELHCNRPTR